MAIQKIKCKIWETPVGAEPYDDVEVLPGYDAEIIATDAAEIFYEDHPDWDSWPIMVEFMHEGVRHEVNIDLEYTPSFFVVGTI